MAVPLDFTVAEVVAMGRSPTSDRPTATRQQIGISAMPHWDESAQAPSGAAITRRCPAGKQRVLVVRALAQQTRLLLLDEPSNHLDVRCQLEILALVRELGLTTVAALHDLNLVARFCNRRYLMAAGRVVASGTPDEVLIPERIAEVFGVRADRWCDPQTGQLHLAFDCLAPRAVRAGSSRMWTAMSPTSMTVSTRSRWRRSAPLRVAKENPCRTAVAAISRSLLRGRGFRPAWRTTLARRP